MPAAEGSDLGMMSTPMETDGDAADAGDATAGS